jgi:hypothetical protein
MNSFLGSFQNVYFQFIGLFPAQLHGLISILLAVLIVIAVVKVLQRDFIFLILLIVLLPASVPVLQNIWHMIVTIVMFLVGKK